MCIKILALKKENRCKCQIKLGRNDIQRLLWEIMLKELCRNTPRSVLWNKSVDCCDTIKRNVMFTGMGWEDYTYITFHFPNPAPTVSHTCTHTQVLFQCSPSSLRIQKHWKRVNLVILFPLTAVVTNCYAGTTVARQYTANPSHKYRQINTS